MKKMTAALALSVTLAGCFGNPMGNTLISNSGALLAGSGNAGATMVAKAPSTVLASNTPLARFARLLVPAVSAAVPSMDDTAMAEATVKIFDVATGTLLLEGKTDAQGKADIKGLEAGKLIKLEVSKGQVVMAAVLIAPAEGNLDLGAIGTDSTVVADLFRVGGFDAELLKLVDNRVIAFIADLVNLKLEDEFEEGTRDKGMLIAALAKHKSDEAKPRNANGEPEEEDDTTTEDPIRKLIAEMGSGGCDEDLVVISRDPSKAPSLAELTSAEQQEVILKTAFLFQYRGEAESEDEDETEAAFLGVPYEAPKAMVVTDAQVQALVKAPAKTIEQIVLALLDAKQKATITVGSQSIDVKAEMLRSGNEAMQDVFETWQEVLEESGQPNATVNATTAIDSPVAALMIAIRIGKESEDVVEAAAETALENAKASMGRAEYDALKRTIKHKPLRIDSQAEMDKLLATLSI